MYLLILVLQFVFLMIKTNQNIKPVNIFGHYFLYTAYADDIKFFIRNKNSVIVLSNVFDTTSVISLSLLMKHYNKKTTLKNISKIENILKVWKMRHLTLEGKINFSKTLTVSKIIHLALVTPISADIIHL